MPQHAHHYILNTTTRLHKLNVIICLHNLNGTEHAQQNTKRPRTICCLKHIIVGECVNRNLNQKLTVFNDRGNKTCSLFTKLFTAARVGKHLQLERWDELFTPPPNIPNSSYAKASVLSLGHSGFRGVHHFKSKMHS